MLTGTNHLTQYERILGLPSTAKLPDQPEFFVPSSASESTSPALGCEVALGTIKLQAAGQAACSRALCGRFLLQSIRHFSITTRASFNE
jgi:hypothetical protein